MASEPEPNLKLLFNIFKLLSYDFGLLSQKEKFFLEEKKLKIPASWKIQTNSINFYILKHKLIIISLPALGSKDKLAVKKVYLELKDLLTKLSLKYPKLPIALFSTWGEYWEKYFLNTFNPPVDLFFGSNSGKGGIFLLNQNKTLWIRPYSKGKTINKIEIIDFQNYQKVNKWLYKQNVFWETIWIGNNVPPDVGVQNMIGED